MYFDKTTANRMVATQTVSTWVNQETGLEEIYLDPELVKSLQRRLGYLEGHTRSIRRMLDDKQDCWKLLIQTLAVKAALNQVIIKVLEGHMEICLIEYIAEGEGVQALDRLKNALDLVLKKS